MASEVSTLTTLEVGGSWASEANLTGAHDDSCATETSSNDYTGEYSMSFNIPAGATIDGIEVLVHYCANDDNDFVVIGLFDSASAWVEKNALHTSDGASIGCDFSQDDTQGTPTDTWTGTWTAAHINSSSFRLRLRAKASGKSGGAWAADYCSVTVYYTEASAEQVMVID